MLSKEEKLLLDKIISSYWIENNRNHPDNVEDFVTSQQLKKKCLDSTNFIDRWLDKYGTKEIETFIEKELEILNSAYLKINKTIQNKYD